MDIHISNCNNLLSGDIHLEEGALNVKYAINGTGKSTIAKAITAKVTGDDSLMQLLKPYQFADDENITPNVTGCDALHSVETFDEDYINRYVYKEELIENSFDIFVKTPDYDQRMGEIGNLLRRIGNTFQDNPELDSLISLFDSFVDGCGRSNTGIAASSPFSKALGKGNRLSNIPEDLEDFRVFLTNTDEGKNVKWLSWQANGREFMDYANQCPYCTASVETSRTKIERLSEEYDSNTIKHLNNILELLQNLSPYFSETTRTNIDALSNRIGEMTEEEKHYIHSIRDEILRMNNQLKKLKNIGFFSIKNADRIVDCIRGYKINLALYPYLNSNLMQEKVSEINQSLDEVEGQAGVLQGKVNQQNALIRNTISENKAAINDFLISAGYRYRVDIVEEDNSFKMKLYPTGIERSVDAVSSRLSYGERNALALVLFMFSALKSNPDLIVLDDPISSFDGNKKFAIINMLFLSERCLRNRTVLLLTHEFNTVIDIVKTMRGRINPVPEAAFLSSANGNLVEKSIRKDDIQPFNQIVSNCIGDTTDNLNKLVFVRRLLEVTGDKGVAWQLLSNLFHNNDRPVPLYREGETERPMTVGEIAEATERIRREWVEDFDYNIEYNKTQDVNFMKDLFNNCGSNYEKLQIYRILNNGNNENNVIRKFVNEVFHVENDFIYQLNPREYDTVPQYVVDECARDLENI